MPGTPLYFVRSSYASAAPNVKPIANLSDAMDVRARLRQNIVLRHLLDFEWRALEPLLAVEEYAKGATLENQGDLSMEQ